MGKLVLAGRRRPARHTARAGWSSRSMTCFSLACGASVTETSLMPSRMASAPASASRSIHSTPKRRLSGKLSPLISLTYSGDIAMPTMRSRSLRPLMISAQRVAGMQPVRLGERDADQHRVPSGRARHAAVAQEHAVEAGFSVGGASDTSRPLAGSSRPGTSSEASNTTRPSAALTPGMVANLGKDEQRRAPDAGEHVGEAVALVVRLLGRAAAPRTSRAW